MTQEPVDQKSPELREMLVAYLDGELDAELARRVEELIARDASVEQELRQLDRAWQLLDRLPRPEVDASFARSTVEIVALAAEKELSPTAPQRRRKAALIGLVLLSACMSGFFAARHWPDGNRELVRDLPILQSLEAYRQTPSMDFLKQLEGDALFAGQPSAKDSEMPRSAGDILAMAPEDKTELHRMYERFIRLPADEQRRLRELHDALLADAQADRLQATLNAYQHWLERLPTIERAELMSLDGDARLARVERMRRDEARRLDADDLAVFSIWINERMMKLAAERPELFPPNFQAAPPARRRQMLGPVLNGLRTSHPFAFMNTFNDTAARAALREKLSPRGRDQLDHSQASDQRRLLMQTWFQQAFSPQAMARAAQLTLPDVSDEELKSFFDRQLDPAQRAELLNLPADQMRRQLRWRYAQWKRGK